MRNVLVGAVESTRSALGTLARCGMAPAAVVTLPPERSGRHSDWADLRPDAASLGVPVLQTTNVNDEALLHQLRQVDPDHVLVIGWSQICRPPFLAVARHGVIGYHPSPLPENRGRAVIPWTILQGRATTGGTLFWMDEDMDSGDILDQEVFDVEPSETAESLYAKHLLILDSMLARSLPLLVAGSAPRRPQDHSAATWCSRRTAADGLIDWRATAGEVWRLVRATGDPYPGAFTDSKGRRLTIWTADHHGAAPYWGLPGQVQAIDASGALVQCGDRHHVLVRTVQLEDDVRRDATEVLAVHERLGTDWRAATGDPRS